MERSSFAGAAVIVAALLLATASSPARAAQGAPTPSPVAPAKPDWQFSGDFRVRYELTTAQQPTATGGVFDPRHREVVRLRAGATRTFGSNLTFAARLTTGAAEDPNSADVTLGDFVDSFEVSLDRAYIEFHRGGIAITGGKFANPFTTTELVWDGDVHPQGVAIAATKKGAWVSPRVALLFFVVDEQSAGADSAMLGGQAQLQFAGASAWSATLSGAYYDYDIRSLRNADAGDIRSNRLKPEGLALASDFNLFDVVLTLEGKGLSPKYPVRLTADVVKNFGAHDRGLGFGFDIFAGRAAAAGDRRFRYGFARAEIDAVLAAFSHDNTTLATNYVQHTASAEWQVRKDVQLNLTWYGTRKLVAASGERNPWVQRLRVNALVSF